MKRKPLRGVDEHVAAIVAAIGRPLHPTKCLDLDAVDRIVAAVTIPADVAVPDIDRQQLLSDLEGELAIYRTGLMMRDRPSDRVQAIADAVKALERGRELLDHYIVEYERLHLWRHITALNRMLEDVGKEKAPELNRIVGLKQKKTISAVEQLVLGLRATFERHWGIDAGYTDNKYTELTTGHVIDFIDAVVEEVDIHYDRGSISRALRK